MIDPFRYEILRATVEHIATERGFVYWSEADDFLLGVRYRRGENQWITSGILNSNSKDQHWGFGDMRWRSGLNSAWYGNIEAALDHADGFELTLNAVHD